MNGSLTATNLPRNPRLPNQLFNLPSFPNFTIHTKTKSISKISLSKPSNPSRPELKSALNINSYKSQANPFPHFFSSTSKKTLSQLLTPPKASSLKPIPKSYLTFRPLEMKGIKIKPQTKLLETFPKPEPEPIKKPELNDSASSYGSSELENEVHAPPEHCPSILMNKFNSPFIRKQSSKRSTVGSLISEFSLRNQNFTLRHQPTIEELLEEMNSTPNVEVYHDLKLKMMGTDPIMEGVNGGSVKWKVVESIGIGGFGQVLKAVDLKTGKVFVVKRLFFNPQNMPQVIFIEALQKEIAIMKTLSHVNIVKYLGSETLDGSHYLYLEYLSGGSLAKLLYQFGPLPEPTVKLYTKQLIAGLKYLHDNGVIHRDIKSENVLLDSNGKIKLSDFGCSKKYSEDVAETGLIASMKGSLLWMAPEVMKQSGYGRKADIWSLGCVVIEMITAKTPWPEAENQINLMMKVAIFNETPAIPSNISNNCQDFIQKCLQKDPARRPTAAELLLHPFINSYN